MHPGGGGTMIKPATTSIAAATVARRARAVGPRHICCFPIPAVSVRSREKLAVAFHRYVRALFRLRHLPQRDHHQERLAPVPLPGEVAVDGSVPDALGVAWLPRTAVGAGGE